MWIVKVCIMDRHIITIIICIILSCISALSFAAELGDVSDVPFTVEEMDVFSAGSMQASPDDLSQDLFSADSSYSSQAAAMEDNPYITIYSPISGNTYVTKNVPINITASVNVQNISFLTSQAVREFSLCRGTICDKGVGFLTKKAISFNDGYHLLKFTARTFSDTYINYTNFTVDSKAPKTIKVNPPSKGYTNGTFSILFDEINGHNYAFYLNNTFVPWTSTTQLWRRIPGTSFVNITFLLSSAVANYNGKVISYTVVVTDKGNHTMSTKVWNVNVDTLKPSLNATYNLALGKFNVSASEKVYLSYYDDFDGKSRILCNKCTTSTASMKFAIGTHNLKVKAVDFAGNTATKEFAVVVE